MAEKKNPMTPLLYRVQRKWQETQDTFSIELVAEKQSLAPFSPGQFNMIYTFGMGEVPISVSGADVDKEKLIHTIRATGTITNNMAKLQPGTMVGLRGPFGSCWPLHQAQEHDILIIAGGIGLAPLRPVIEHIMEKRSCFGRVSLLYGTRSPDLLLYASEYDVWREQGSLQVEVTVDIAHKDWRGHVGVVTTLISHAEFTPKRTIAMICGPEIMMRFSLAKLQEFGVPDENIFLSLERNMKCAIGLCGHCQYGPHFICKDGPVFAFPHLIRWWSKRKL